MVKFEEQLTEMPPAMLATSQGLAQEVEAPMHAECISLPISRTTEYGFAFIEPIPLDHRFEYTPMWQEAPRAPVVLTNDSGWPRWTVVRCPFCAREHTHNIDPHEDPRLFLGGRCSHCLPRIPEDPHHLSEYRLIAITGAPTEEGLDRHFPLWWHIGNSPSNSTMHKRIAFPSRTKRAVWRKSDGFCWYCGDELDPFVGFEIDHFLSLKNGGSNKIANLVPSCRSCNAKKSHWHVEIFRTRHHAKQLFWFEQAGKVAPQ